MSDVPHSVSRKEPLPEGDRERVLQRLADVLGREDDVVFAYAFGSFVEGPRFEDIDVAILLSPKAGERPDLLGRQLELAGRLEAAAGLPVDVVLLNDAPLGLRAAAVRGRLLYSRDEAARIFFIEQTSLQVMDMAFLAQESLKDLLGRQ